MLVVGRIFVATIVKPTRHEFIFTLTAGRAHGLGFSRSESGALVVASHNSSPYRGNGVGTDGSVQLGDVVKSVNGDVIIGYNQACCMWPPLLQPDSPLEGQIVLGLHRVGGAGSTSWRGQIREQLRRMGADGDAGGSAGAGGHGEAVGDELPPKRFSWAVSAGRPGKDGYQAGDISRSAAKGLGAFARKGC